MKTLLPLAIILCILTGCSEPGAGPPPLDVSFQTWQRSVEQYVVDVGNGDANALRDGTIWSGQRGFALIREPSIERSTDAIGLLLGHRVISDRLWFIYLVALVERNSISDVRLLGLCCDAGNFDWVAGETSALREYKSHRADTSEDSPSPAFPGADDAFELTVVASHVTVTESNSAARWEMNVPSQTISDSGESVGAGTPRIVLRPAQ